MRERDEEDCHFKPDGRERLTGMRTCGEELHLLRRQMCGHLGKDILGRGNNRCKGPEVAG